MNKHAVKHTSYKGLGKHMKAASKEKKNYYYSKSPNDYGEVKTARFSVKVTPGAKENLREVVASSLGEKISLSDMLEQIARGQLKVERV